MTEGGELGRILAEHQGLVRGFFGRRCERVEDAEDLAQEAWCAIIAGYPRFRASAGVSTWIWAICRNILSRHLARDRRREELVKTLGRLRPAEELGEPVAGELSTGDEIGRLELGLLLAGLGPGDRTLYRCYYELGLSIRETAGILDRPEGTIKYQLYCLRERIRRLISGQD